MFDAFELQPDLHATRKRLVVSLVGAALVLTAVGAGVAAIAARTPALDIKKNVDVSFRPPPPPPEPVVLDTPPPPPPPKAKPKPPPMPVIVEAPPPVAAPAAAPAAAPLAAPKAIPTKSAPESDTAVTAVTTAVGAQGDGTGTAVGTAGGHGDEESAAPVIAKAGSTGPVNLPEDAEPPEPNEDNAQPEYPESARTTGQESKVVLKVVIERDGRVGRIQILKGEEPFTSAALAAVRTWKYEPATLDGVPLAVFKIVNLTFSLRE